MENGKSSTAVQRFEILKHLTPIYRVSKSCRSAERPTPFAQRLLNFPQSAERIVKPLSGWQNPTKSAERLHKPLSELVLERFCFLRVFWLSEFIQPLSEWQAIRWARQMNRWANEPWKPLCFLPISGWADLQNRWADCKIFAKPLSELIKPLSGFVQKTTLNSKLFSLLFSLTLTLTPLHTHTQHHYTYI